jgi:precorrin-6B methylase 2
MQTDYETTNTAPPTTPYGKIIGVVKYRYQLKALCESLAAIGVREVEILDGSAGLHKLLAWEETFSHYILGQRETDLLTRYIDAVKSDLIVFTAAVEVGEENAAADTAKAHGATRVSHFGNSVVTSY